MAKSSTDNHVQSVERALAVLESIVDAGEIGVSELGQKLGLHVATVHNILRTLTARQYLQNVNGRYRPGPSLAVLLSRSQPITLLARMAQPVLEQLSETTQEATSFTVLTGTTAKLIAFHPGKHAITIHYPQWVWPDPLLLATGQVLVAYASDAIRQTCIENHRQKDASVSATDWEKHFADIRTTAYASITFPDRDGQYAFASGISGADGKILAAIGASCPKFRADEANKKLMQESVKSAAQLLSGELSRIATA